MTDTAFQTCCTCGQVLPLNSFHRSKARKTGHSSKCKTCAKRAAQKWYRDNPERAQASRRSWDHRNRSRVTERNREWRLTHPLESFFIRKAQRSNSRSPSGKVTAAQVRARWDYYGGRCWVCRSIATEIDHVKPMGWGGAGLPCNIRPICARCNKAKSSTWKGIHTNSLRRRAS